MEAKYWSAADIERMGRDWYSEAIPREYGFSISEGHLSVHYGRVTHDSSTEQYWGCFLPWTQWRHVRHSFYGLHGEHLFDEPQGPCRLGDGWEARRAREATVPTVSFRFEDFDGELLTATTKIEEREWRFGEGWFKWLSAFRRPKIWRSLDLNFSGETGREKGSWKGGTTGHSIDMLPGELHEAAFRRYCAQEHRSKSVDGYHAGLRGDDPRTCPHEKMTKEWREWQMWHAWGVDRRRAHEAFANGEIAP